VLADLPAEVLPGLPGRLPAGLPGGAADGPRATAVRRRAAAGGVPGDVPAGQATGPAAGGEAEGAAAATCAACAGEFPEQAAGLQAELAFVIGKTARHVPKEKALDFVDGYMTFNDVSARDIQRRGSQWVLGKSVETFAVAGPYLVLKDEIPDPQKLEIKASIGQEVLQHSNTADMIFSVADIIADLSRFLTLQPGTVIATGTPSGVGSARKPQRWLRPGETIRVEVQGLGVLENPIEQE
jgi:hypothetical protein